VYLTPEGEEASDGDWLPYSYADIHRVFRRVLNTNTGSVGDDVAAFLEHYLNLVKGRMMHDPEIDELCRQIYKKHRQALDLIIERVGLGGNKVLDAVAEIIKAGPNWHWVNTTTKWVVFMPKPLFEAIPPIGDRAQFNPKEWIVFNFRLDGKGRLTFGVTVWPTTDGAARERVINRLTSSRNLSLRTRSKGASGRWTHLTKEPVTDLDLDDEEPNLAGIENVIGQTLASLWGRFATVHEIVLDALGASHGQTPIRGEDCMRPSPA
jgi:hypothetical protein